MTHQADPGRGALPPRAARAPRDIFRQKMGRG